MSHSDDPVDMLSSDTMSDSDGGNEMQTGLVRLQATLRREIAEMTALARGDGGLPREVVQLGAGDNVEESSPGSALSTGLSFLPPDTRLVRMGVRTYADFNEFVANHQRVATSQEAAELERQNKKMTQMLNTQLERDKLPWDTPLPIYLKHREPDPPKMRDWGPPIAVPEDEFDELEIDHNWSDEDA